jgi:hypothetical protein
MARQVSIQPMQVERLCESLSRVRPVFHSEADFQHALACHIHERHLDEATGVPYEVGDAVAFSPAGSAAVRGKSEPVATYVPLVPEDTEVRPAARVPWTS